MEGRDVISTENEAHLCRGLPLTPLFLPHPTDEAYTRHPYPKADTRATDNFPEDSHIIVYTDASGGPNNQWAHLRIIGQASVIVHPSTHQCLWVLLGGAEGPQTVPAGELQAAVSFLQYLRRAVRDRPHVTHVDLHTDSKYVHNHWLQRTSDTQANTRLWRLFWEAEADPQFTLDMHKVAAHKTLEEAQRGEIPMIDFI